jgi:hypothetical protein
LFLPFCDKNSIVSQQMVSELMDVDNSMDVTSTSRSIASTMLKVQQKWFGETPSFTLVSNSKSVHHGQTDLPKVHLCVVQNYDP